MKVLSKRSFFAVFIITALFVGSVGLVFAQGLTNEQANSLDLCSQNEHITLVLTGEKAVRYRPGDPIPLFEKLTQFMQNCACGKDNLKSQVFPKECGFVQEKTVDLTFTLTLSPENYWQVIDPKSIQKAAIYPPQKITCKESEKPCSKPLTLQSVGDPSCSYSISVKINDPNNPTPETTSITSCVPSAGCTNEKLKVIGCQQAPFPGTIPLISTKPAASEEQTKTGSETTVPFPKTSEEKQYAWYDPRGWFGSGAAIKGAPELESESESSFSLGQMLLGALLASGLAVTLIARRAMSSGEEIGNQINRRSFNSFNHFLNSNNYERSLGGGI